MSFVKRWTLYGRLLALSTAWLLVEHRGTEEPTVLAARDPIPYIDDVRTADGYRKQ